jgi:hypothetical protein
MHNMKHSISAKPWNGYFQVGNACSVPVLPPAMRQPAGQTLYAGRGSSFIAGACWAKQVSVGQEQLMTFNLRGEIQEVIE